MCVVMSVAGAVNMCEHVCGCGEVWIHRCAGLLLSASASETGPCPHTLQICFLCGAPSVCISHPLLDAAVPCTTLGITSLWHPGWTGDPPQLTQPLDTNPILCPQLWIPL